MIFHKNKMQDTNIIGDDAKDRSIDYGLIDRINKQYEREGRKAELNERLAKKRGTQKEEKEKQNPAKGIKYIKTPDELRDIKGNYSLQKGAYVIDFEIYVPNGCGLILEPGVEFYFTKNAGITCEGRFEAKGKSGLEVLLTAKNKAQGWKNLSLKGGAEAILDYAGFSYGKGREDEDGVRCGGAILLKSKEGLKPSITINNSCFYNNSAKYGGVIYNLNGDVKIIKSNKFKNNSANSDGGVIYNKVQGKIRIDEKNIFEHNSAGEGGVINNNKGDVIIKKDNKFENNSANWGGAIYNRQGDITIKDKNNFKKNSATDRGGAIYNLKGNVRINKKNIFENNSAYEGGAIRDYKGNLEIDESKNIFKSNKPNDIYYET